MTTIFTDGSSLGNPGPGGWAAVIVQSAKLKVKNEQKDDAGKTGEMQVRELGGSEKHTTNNRMELTAAVQALEHTGAGKSTTLYTDSQYLINGITKWVKGWKQNGWKTKTKEDVLNRDLWEELESLTAERNISFIYVGGHVGIVGNERCDHIATDLAAGVAVKLYEGPLSGYDLPNILDISFDSQKHADKSSDRSRSRAKAYSYISSVGGVIHVDHSWPECEKRVKGKAGARYKKSLDAADEAKIIEEFEAFLV